MGTHKIGIIGAGTIARAIIDMALGSERVSIDYVLLTGSRTKSLELPGVLCTTDPQAILSREVDLVVEAAVPAVLARLAPALLERADLCGFSCTAMADQDLFDTVQKTAARSGRRYFVPHGAVLGLDGFADARDLIDTVTVTTHKSGSSFGLSEETSGVVFNGSAREAARLYPRNVNVHAALALAGIGFDRTASTIVAVPGQSTMEHKIRVKGRGLDWDIAVSSPSLGGITGAFTPVSAVGSVRRILGGEGLWVS